MTAKEFNAWMKSADCVKAADIVRKLDVGRNQAQQWLAQAKAGQDVEVKLTVALAMTALANRLGPWPEA